MRECKEEPDKYGHYCCGDGKTINGKRVCSDDTIQLQIDYAGHPFCACLGREIDAAQMTINWRDESDDNEERQFNTEVRADQHKA